MHLPVQLPHHLVHAHQCQFGHPRTQVTDALQQLTHQVRQCLLCQQLGVELYDCSYLVDRLELDAPIAVLYLDEGSLKFSLGVLERTEALALDVGDVALAHRSLYRRFVGLVLGGAGVLCLL